MGKRTIYGVILLVILSVRLSLAQEMKIARLKYDGGGDWYANRTALPNLIAFTNKNIKTDLFKNEDQVDAGSPDLFLYPYVYMTGHGNVVFNSIQSSNLRKYLTSGGFLHIDDNYGLDPFIRLEIKKIFPKNEWVELPFDHEIYHQYYDFDSGLPKIHQHDGQPPQGFGIFYEGKLVVFYTYECDLGNGWEDASIHNDPEDVRLKALKMGANIISYTFNANL
ncbi:MAG: hypothetical protein CBB92_03040 [Flammeovirgaceae bacterium TMED32]|nr:MAG: hypothetical protein CBB92_03040 [Flammeovirgaceae bacterium TMED32]|tara:strand:+ start:789 stop:1454 length:666 start_codon:yes stop_codon:yes gene_type:complete